MDFETAHTQHEPLTVQEKDEDLLADLGYKQELTRNWSLLHNFGVSFSIIVSSCSILIARFLGALSSVVIFGTLSMTRLLDLSLGTLPY